jgi:hypothetical protein
MVKLSGVFDAKKKKLKKFKLTLDKGVLNVLSYVRTYACPPACD